MIFYIISKIIPLLVLPLGLSLVFNIVGLFFKKRIFILIGFATLSIFSIDIVSDSLLRFVERPWERIKIDKSNNSNAIVVLSGSLHPSPGDDKIIEWQDPDRFLSGIELFKQKKAPFIIFTEGKNPFRKKMQGEGTFYIKEAIKRGIPLNAIRNTKEVFNTIEEASEVKKVVNKMNFENEEIILVTSAFHMQRAKRLFERSGFVVKPFPVDFKSTGEWSEIKKNILMRWIPNSRSLNNSSLALREIIGRIIYRTF